MVNRIFLDVNIILDILVRERKTHKYSKRLLSKLINYEIFISEDMLSTIYYYISKNKEKTLEFFQVILSEWNIVPFGKQVIYDSIQYSLKYKSNLEDTLQCFCAKENSCAIFLTSDKSFINCGIKIVDYKEFLGDDL